MTKGKIPTRIIFGIPIACLTLKEVSNTVIDLIKREGKKTFFYIDSNCINLANKDLSYKKILQRAIIAYPAGVGVILASKILGQPLKERTSTLDFIEQIFEKAEQRKWSFYFLGGDAKDVQQSVYNLQKKFPKLRIVGYHHGFFTRNSEIIKKINLLKPDILIVGMGKPRQEEWISENIDKIDARTFWAVGALFDFLSGKRKRAPKWMQRMGIEWVFRLIQEPGRLWRRYLIGNIFFLISVFQQKAISSYDN